MSKTWGVAVRLVNGRILILTALEGLQERVVINYNIGYV